VLDDSLFEGWLDVKTPEEVSDEFRSDLSGEGLEPEPLVVSPLRPGGQGFGAVGGKEENRAVEDRAGDVGQELFGDLVDPVDVFEEEDEGLLFAECGEEALHRFEGPELPPLGV